MQDHNRSTKNYVSVHYGYSSDGILLCATQTWTLRLSSMSGHSKVSHWRRPISCVQTHFEVSSHWNLQLNIPSPMYFNVTALLMSQSQSMSGCKSQSCVTCPGVGWESLMTLVTSVTRCQHPDQLRCHATLSLSPLLPRPTAADSDVRRGGGVVRQHTSDNSHHHVHSLYTWHLPQSSPRLTVEPRHICPLWPHASWTSLKKYYSWSLF